MSNRNVHGQFVNKYPFQEIDVGGKALIKVPKDEDFDKFYAKIRSAAYIFGKREGVSFSCSRHANLIEVRRKK